MDEVTFGQILDAVDSIGLAIVILIMFTRGDIISRRVYEDLTEVLVTRLMTKIDVVVDRAVERAFNRVMYDRERDTSSSA